MTWKSPRPATCPSFAERYTTVNIIGRMTGVAHRKPKPNFAPALAYVPIAEGSLSAAPVMIPRPSVFATLPRLREGSRAVLLESGADSAPPPRETALRCCSFSVTSVVVLASGIRRSHESAARRTARLRVETEVLTNPRPASGVPALTVAEGDCQRAGSVGHYL